MDYTVCQTAIPESGTIKDFIGSGEAPLGEIIESCGEGEGMRKAIHHLFVNGVPLAQPRPRRAKNGGVYNPPTADAWKAEVKATFRRDCRPLITGPVHLRVSFFMPRPKKMKAGEIEKIPHVKKPDTDNLLKSTMDAMTEARVWQDDAQVYAIEVGKWYARENKTGAQIIVEAD